MTDKDEYESAWIGFEQLADRLTLCLEEYRRRRIPDADSKNPFHWFKRSARRFRNLVAKYRAETRHRLIPGAVLEKDLVNYAVGLANRCYRIALYVNPVDSREEIEKNLRFLKSRYNLQFPPGELVTSSERGSPEANPGFGGFRELLHQIERGLKENLYYLSLFVALCIPDICGAASGNSDPGDRYRSWFDKYMSQHYPGELDGETCYRLRCSLLHQGTSRLDQKISKGRSSRYKQILFVEPQTIPAVYHRITSSGFFMIDLPIFCREIIAAANCWLEANQTDEEVKRNFSRFMSRHPEGFPPVIYGTPVIASGGEDW